MTLVTQKASFGASRKENLDKSDMKLAVLSNSGSNINIIQQKDTKLWGIPETYENKPGRLNDIGTNDDTGPKCTLLSSVQFEQMGYKWESSRAVKGIMHLNSTRWDQDTNQRNFIYR